MSMCTYPVIHILSIRHLGCSEQCAPIVAELLHRKVHTDLRNKVNLMALQIRYSFVLFICSCIRFFKSPSSIFNN